VLKIECYDTFEDSRDNHGGLHRTDHIRVASSSSPLPDIRYACFRPAMLQRRQTLLPTIYRLLGLGKGNAVRPEVVDRVIFPEESITKNDKRASRFRNIHAGERRDAGSTSLNNVVVRGDSEVGASEGESHVGEGIALVALEAVLTTEALLGTDFLVDELSHGGWQNDERCTSVQNGTSVLEFGRFLAKDDGIKVDLPVGLAPQRKLGELAGVVKLIDTTKDNLGVGLGITQVEGELLLVEKVLVDHVVERWDDLVDRNRVVSKSENTVEASKSESETWLSCGFCKVLTLEFQVANLDSVL
jgi:hypothetical protein